MPDLMTPGTGSGFAYDPFQAFGTRDQGAGLPMNALARFAMSDVQPRMDYSTPPLPPYRPQLPPSMPVPSFDRHYPQFGLEPETRHYSLLERDPRLMEMGGARTLDQAWKPAAGAIWNALTTPYTTGSVGPLSYSGSYDPLEGRQSLSGRVGLTFRY